MSDDDNQILIPHSFIALFLSPGAQRPNQPRAWIAQRYELCEDLAQMLSDSAQEALVESGGGRPEMIARVRQALQADVSVVNAQEAAWVMQRWSELMGWPAPEIPSGPRPSPG
jgi:hypothetical protein